MSTQIHSGGQLTKDPNSEEFVTVDWDIEHLPEGVTIDVSDFEITGPDAELTFDNDDILTGQRQTTLRLIGGTEGKRYTVTNRITTDETPTQIKDASFRVLVQQE
jgi:hypothetical protein